YELDARDCVLAVSAAGRDRSRLRNRPDRHRADDRRVGAGRDCGARPELHGGKLAKSQKQQKNSEVQPRTAKNGKSSQSLPLLLNLSPGPSPFTERGKGAGG